MAIRFKLLLLLILMTAVSLCFGQDYEIRTLFGNNGVRASGGFGAIGNKFTTVNGHFANLAEVYGGWYINHKFLLGVSGAASTNHIPVAPEFSVMPGSTMSYEYGQCGLMLEYVVGSRRAIHLAFQLFNGAGFTAQYSRGTIHGDHDPDWDEIDDSVHGSDWFFVTEPGVKIEMNLFRWMRFCPGVSYRTAFNSNAPGLTDSDLSAPSVNLTLKFGKF